MGPVSFSSSASPLMKKRTAIFSFLMGTMISVGTEGEASGQSLLGSGLPGSGRGSLLGGGPVGGFVNGTLDILSPITNAVPGLLGGVTGTVGQVISSPQTGASGVNGQTPALGGLTTNLLGGVISLVGPTSTTDSETMLNRYHLLEMRTINSVDPGASGDIGRLIGGSPTITSGLSGAESLFFFGWTPSGYRSVFSSPALRDFGPQGALLNRAPAKSGTNGANTAPW